MTAINRAPTGWLGFLGIKNFGRNPATAADVLAPTWDLSELYLSAQRRWIIGATTINGIGTFALAGPPPGQIWYYHGACAFAAALAAGNTLNFEFALYNVALGQAVSLAGTGPQLAAPVGSRPTAKLARPIIVQPGEALALWVNEWTGANIGCTVNSVITVLDA